MGLFVRTVTLKDSYGGSGSQARAVINGLDSDVVSLAMTADVNKKQQAGLINSGWERENPCNSTSFYSMVAMFVRPGNPKKITGFKDLGNKDLQVVAANPKTQPGPVKIHRPLGAITRLAALILWHVALSLDSPRM